MNFNYENHRLWIQCQCRGEDKANIVQRILNVFIALHININITQIILMHTQLKLAQVAEICNIHVEHCKCFTFPVCVFLLKKQQKKFYE